MSRDAEAEASLRGRLESMFSAIGESRSSIADVVVGDRELMAGYDSEWFAAVTFNSTAYAVFRRGDYLTVEGCSPDDVCGQVIDVIRSEAGAKAEAEMGNAQHSIEVARSFARMALSDSRRIDHHVDYSRSVLSACEAINGHYSGSGEPMSDEELAATVAFLRGRVAAWMPTARHFGQECYDAAVLTLVQAALGLHDWASS